MVDNRERDCFRRWMWFRVNPRLMRILKYAREDTRVGLQFRVQCNQHCMQAAVGLLQCMRQWVIYMAAV